MNNRLYYLDGVRAFALLLGIVFHAALTFVPTYIGWAVMDISTSSVVLWFATISHSFRLELFFLIAGFFSHMTFHKKGAKSFLKARALRIAIPFALGWFLLRPLIVSGWIMGAESMRGDVHVMAGLVSGFKTLGELPHNLFVGSHLWFLYYLLLLTGLLLTSRWVVKKTPFAFDLEKRTDQAVAWLAESPFALAALSIPTALCLNFMGNWGMDTPDKSLLPHLPVTLVYGAYFFLGWLFHRQADLLARFGRLTAGRLAAGVTSCAVTLILSSYQYDLSNPYFGFYKAAFSLSYALMMWSLVSICIGLFNRLLDRPNVVVRYVADSSYWLYLIHLPIVVWLQVAFASVTLHWSLKLGAISTITIGLGLLLYHSLVRPTPLSALLSGSRRKFNRAPSY